MPTMKKLVVNKEYAGVRVDVFLRAHYPEFSRAWIQKLIKKGNAKVNDKPVQSSRKLKTGDTVNFEPEPPPEISLEPDKSLTDKIKIIFENGDFIVIDKSAGISVHPSSNEPKGTVVNWLLAHYPPIKTVGDFYPNYKLLITNYSFRPGIVHRLDKDTSGVMVIAKNQTTFLWLKKQFQTRQVTKKYLALVNGSPQNDSGEIGLNIARSKSDPTRNTVSKSKTFGREAVTRWQVIKRYADHALLEVTPKTGRMHQIRVHLKAKGWPVAGDKKYGVRRLDPKHLGRMFLHAKYLSFRDESGDKFSFECPLPQDLEQCLINLPYVLA